MKQFAEEHTRETGITPNKFWVDYPDCGQGRFSKELDYKTWFQFNSAQRAHLNYVENFYADFVLLAISGLYYPFIAALFGFLYMVGRVLYTVLYISKGPSGRTLGGAIMNLAKLGMLVLSFVSLFQIYSNALDA